MLRCIVFAGEAPEQESQESLSALAPSKIGNAADDVTPEEAPQESLSAPAVSRVGKAADDAAPEEATTEEGLSALLQVRLIPQTLCYMPSLTNL